MRAPSPALVVSIVALVFAVAGVGYAAVKITGKDVKNRSLTGKDVKANSLRGKQIRESSLAKVPRAVRADSAALADQATQADTAASAAQLGGIAPGGFVQGRGSVSSATLDLNDGQADVDLISVPGVGKVTADCSGGANAIRTEFNNQSGEQVLRVTQAVRGSASEVTAGGLDPGDSTATTTSDPGERQGHVHTYSVRPFDGGGPSAEIRVVGVSSVPDPERCLLSALATVAQ